MTVHSQRKFEAVFGAFLYERFSQRYASEYWLKYEGIEFLSVCYVFIWHFSAKRVISYGVLMISGALSSPMWMQCDMVRDGGFV